MNRKPHVTLSALALLAVTALAASAATPARAPHAAAAPQVAPAPAPDDADGMFVSLFDDGDDFDGAMAVDAAGPGPAGRNDAHPGMGRGGMHAGGADCGMQCGSRGGPMMKGGMRGAFGHRMMPPMAGMRPFGHMGAALGLTDAQRQKLQDIHERQQRRAVQARADIEIANLDLRHAMRAENPSATEIGTQIDRVAKLRADLQKSRVATMLEARAVLTPEQQKKMRELHEAGPGPGMHPGGGRGLGMGHGPGGASDSQ